MVAYLRLFNQEIKKDKNGRIDANYERELFIDWISYQGWLYDKISFGQSKGFFLVRNTAGKRKKVYVCCTRDLGTINEGRFWFGFRENYITGNADMGIVLIFVWENREREYLVLSNRDVLTLRNIWYLKDSYYSIDILHKRGEYLMMGKNGFRENFGLYINDINRLFE